jgi:hypothetical protein
MRNLILAIILWLIAVAIEIGNRSLFGNTGSELYRLAVMLPVILILAWIYARQTRGDGWGTSAIGAGILWVGLSVILKLVCNRYILCAPSEETIQKLPLADYKILLENIRECMMSDYNIGQGKLWPVVLAIALVAPLIMGIKYNR